MKCLFSSLILSLALIGCSSSSVHNSNIAQDVHLSGGQAMGDATSLYWYTKKVQKSQSAADYVTIGDYGWYKTDYRWEEGVLREVIRKGETLKQYQGGLKPFSTHIRYNGAGEAVYQQYRLDGRVLPLSTSQLAQYAEEALHLIEVVEEQNNKGQSLYQGEWDGEAFETCQGEDFDQLAFNQSLPSFVVSRLSSVDSFIGFIGSSHNSELSVAQILLLADDSFDCIDRPELIED